MMASITVMKERLEEALHVLESALMEAVAPGSLLEIALQKVVDRPIQLICVQIFICQHTEKRDIAG